MKLNHIVSIINSDQFFIFINCKRFLCVRKIN